MEAVEKAWALKAQELNNCPFYSKDDSIQVRMPGVFGNQLQVCSMPIASFIPIALDGKQSQGKIESGFKTCSCRWSFCQVNKLSNPAVEFEEVLTAEDQMSKPFLEQLPVHVSESFRARATPMHFKSGNVILDANITSSHFHVIVKGLVRISNRGKDGRILELSVLRKGDCFGEMSILTGASTSNQVDALEDCITMAISRTDFHKLIADFPVLSIILYRMLSKRIKANNQKLTQLMSPGLSGDLCFFPFVELVQTVMNAHMTGILVMELAECIAQFGFHEGQLHHGSLGILQGTEALNEVLLWRSGSFQFHTEATLPPRNMEGDTMAMLLEALRCMDESTMMENPSQNPQKDS